jgi:GTPase SAR1 family protein
LTAKYRRITQVQNTGRWSSLVLKIGITGLNSTGKTTLAKAVALDMSLEFVEEGIPAAIYHETSVLDKARLILEFAKEKIQKYSKCVVDRTGIDIAMMILTRPKILPLEISQSAYEECKAIAQELDLLVMLPDGVIPRKEEYNEAGLRRISNPLAITRNTILLNGLVSEMHQPHQVLRMPKSANTVKSRIEEIRSHAQINIDRTSVLRQMQPTSTIKRAWRTP